MSETLIFDTLRFAKRMTDHGMAPDLAEALADEAAHALQTNIPTKNDLQTLEIRLQTRLQTEIVAAKFDLLKWIIMALITQGGVIVALIKLL